MRAVIQRVSSSSVSIDGKVKSAIGRPVGTGEFRADMKVALVNDGPVTIYIDTKTI